MFTRAMLTSTPLARKIGLGGGLFHSHITSNTSTCTGREAEASSDVSLVVEGCVTRAQQQYRWLDYRCQLARSCRAHGGVIPLVHTNGT